MDPVVISKNKYNELGQLEEKDIHSTDMDEFLQNINYSYNIRGWLTQINDPEDLSSDNDYFGMKLSYESPDPALGTTAMFNGNISAVSWNFNDDDDAMAYEYKYDALNRILAANYHIEYYDSWLGLQDYSISDLNYDLNGNILELKRTSYGSYIDKLTYNYEKDGSQGNQLISVSDVSQNSNGFYDGNTNGTDYEYDANGNMYIDSNKGIKIDYNFLNLPERVHPEVTGTDAIRFIYDASGVKWQKKVTGSNVTTTTYNGSFIYSGKPGNMSLDYALNSEGMIKNGASPQFHYFLKDHLGNTRAVIYDADADGQLDSTSSELLQQTDYYPFGMPFEPAPFGADNKYLYNGKEMQEDAIGGVGLDWYDYGARFYDPFMGLDSIYANNFWGNNQYIGNDGKNDGNVYLVKGGTKRGVKNATKNGVDFTGNLSESDEVAHIPTGGVMDDVVNSVNETNTSNKENGGHANTGDANATRWDEGTPAKEVKDAEGKVIGAKASISPFVIGGSQNIPADASNVDIYWHVHPDTKVGGLSLGSSTPSAADKSFQGTMEKRGYSGNAFVVGARTNKVTFYNSRKSIITIKYQDFRRIGGGN
jgi:hypothetical protein